MNANELLAAYPKANTPGQLRGWKAKLTRYCNERAQETGSKPNRFRAAIKATLTRQGHDTQGV